MCALGVEAAVPLLIGGKQVAESSNGTFLTINPATDTPIQSVAKAGLPEVSQAVESARKAFDSGVWSRLRPSDRGRVLARVAREIELRFDAILETECRDSGKPVSKASGEIREAIATFDYYAGASDKLFGHSIPIGDSLIDFTLREPVGVAALIVPWNFPFLMAVRKVAPALAAGCTIVLKPASNTPLSALMLGQLCVDAGVPEGVVSVLPGPGALVGEALASHPRVDKVAFTGETATGRDILRGAAGTVKSVTLELGGKSPSIVFDDADVDAAVAEAVPSAFSNTGQTCTARSRLLVQHTIYDRVVQDLISLAGTFMPGDPMDASTKMGPLISRAQAERVSAYIDLGRSEGAELVFGGSALPDLGPNYIEPTIFAGATNEMRIAQEEIFGPVLAVIPFKDEADAIDLANHSAYGLAGSVWTQNAGKALRVARALQCGMVSVNSNGSAGVLTPFGGYKQSGLGRELSMEGLAAYTQIKNVYMSIGD